jgi:hypothetical protein
MNTEKEAVVYIVVVGRSGEVLARRYLERERLSEWLQRNGPGGAQVEVFTQAPEKGGARISVLRRHVDHEWVAA